MKALVLTGTDRLELLEVKKPEPLPGWAVIQVMASAVCATDLEFIAGHIGKKIYPRIPGHEWSGIVESVGEKKDNRWIGKRVVGTNDVSCLSCPECRKGNIRYCREFKEIGFLLDGAYAEYITVPVYCLYELPENISFIQGAMIEPLGVGVDCVIKAGVGIGDHVTVIGAGSIGLNICAVAKAAGAGHVIVAARSKKRAEFARSVGADEIIATENQNLIMEVNRLHPGGSDISIDATGNEDCIADCLRLTCPGGTIVLAGYGGYQKMQITIDDIHIKNLHVIGAGNNWNVIEKSISLLKNGSVKTEHFATFITDLADYKSALEKTRTRPTGFVKSIFVFNGEDRR